MSKGEQDLIELGYKHVEMTIKNLILTDLLQLGWSWNEKFM